MEKKSFVCPCKRSCERHGNCKACNEYHRDSKKKHLTACERLKLQKRKKKQTESEKEKQG